MNSNQLQQVFSIVNRKFSNHPYMAVNHSKMHYTFLFDGTKLVSYGMNFAIPNGETFHSEFDCLRKVNWDNKIKRMELFNVRINQNKELKIAAPCEKCKTLIKKLGIYKVYYTNEEGMISKYVC